MYSSIWQASSDETHVTVHASSLIFQITFRSKYDLIGCCGCCLLREGVTGLRGAKISTRNHLTWIHVFLKNEYFAVLMDYQLLPTRSFLEPISQPWQYRKPSSHLLPAARQLRGKEHIPLGRTPFGHSKVLYSHSASNILRDMKILCLFQWHLTYTSCSRVETGTNPLGSNPLLNKPKC